MTLRIIPIFNIFVCTLCINCMGEQINNPAGLDCPPKLQRRMGETHQIQSCNLPIDGLHPSYKLNAKI